MARAKPPVNGYNTDRLRVCPVCGRSFVAAVFHQAVASFKDKGGVPRRVFLCRESCFQKFEKERLGR